MQDEDDTGTVLTTEQPGIAALLTQLGDDAATLARAEMRYLQAQAGERVAIAMPALLMLVASGVLILGVIIATMVGAMLLLKPFVGMLLAMVIVIAAMSLLAFVLYRTGRIRMARVFTKLEA